MQSLFNGWWCRTSAVVHSGNECVTNTDLGLAGAPPVCKVYLALYESSQEVTIMVTNEA